jgi:hypothetical protein
MRRSKFEHHDGNSDGEHSTAEILHTAFLIFGPPPFTAIGSEVINAC